MTALVWFRRDLRLADNPALQRALANHDHVVPVFIHAPHEEAPWEPGAASNWWLHHSLSALAAQLNELGSGLVIRQGDSLACLQDLIKETGADAVYWNRLYEPAVIARDKVVKASLRETDIEAESANAALINEPWEVETDSGAPYKVFTPYWRKAREVLGALTVAAAPESLSSGELPESIELDELKLLPTLRWADGFADEWQPGEKGAHAKLDAFLDGVIADYAEGRNHADQAATSRLSAHLHFGEISPRQIAVAVQQAVAGTAAWDNSADKYLSEVGWREFAYHLLYHFPETTDQPLHKRFESFPWRDGDNEDFAAWCAGDTGIPMVDAGMRELWATGYMHNRVRMVVASLLTKNQQISWLEGARWFWDTLVDADLASNTLGWQWTAGCGADAAPFFRVFNPVRQGERFDTSGEYVRRWCPELKGLSQKNLHQPWEATADELEEAGVVLGESYPKPVVDLKTSRQDALDAYAVIKEMSA